MWVGKQQEQIQKDCFKNKAKTLAQDDPLWWKFQWMVMLMVQPYITFYFLKLHRSVTAYYIPKKSFSIFFEAVTFNLLVVKILLLSH